MIFKLLLITTAISACECALLRQQNQGSSISHERELVEQYYFKTSNFGEFNPNVAIGNPMKGLAGNPWANKLEYWPESLKASLGVFKIPLDTVLLQDPDTVSANEAYNWTVVDEALELVESYHMHGIIRFWVHWPGKPLALPDYMERQPKKVELISTWGDVAPYYGDPIFRDELKKFIMAFGKRYDGDTRLFAIQGGFLGRYGEWHTTGCEYKNDKCLPDYVKDETYGWLSKAFTQTKVQVRYPNHRIAFEGGAGFHDDSYTYTTVGGKANGGFDKNAMFWTMANANSVSEFWKRGPMGGEVRPENIDVFKPSYPGGTEWHQDFMVCATTTHTTYMLHSASFVRGGPGPGDEYNNARFAHVRMGYNFRVDNVAAALSTNTNNVDLAVTMVQEGVAPFYYPLYLSAYCEGIKKSSQKIMSDLHDKGNSAVILLTGVPSTTNCLGSVELKLESPFTYTERPIKWAQGSDGKVILRIPLPEGQPNPSPVRSPPTVSLPPPTRPPLDDFEADLPLIPIPTNIPPVKSPVQAPVQAPVKAPVKAPVAPPTNNGSSGGFVSWFTWLFGRSSKLWRKN